MTDPIIHLYPLENEHGDASVVGNREGLRLLRDAIKDALQEGEGQTTYLGPFAEDGEEYDLGVTLQLGGPHADGWARWREPYFVSRDQYRELGGED